MTDFGYGPPRDDQETAAYLDLLVESFRFDREIMPRWMERVGLSNFRLGRLGSRVKAGLGMLEVGQWFGGKLLPMGAVLAVAVAPDARGTGIGKALMTEALREMHDRGVPLSALYASTQRVYRGVGYEQAASAYHYSASAGAFPAGDRSMPVQPVDLDDLAQLKALRSEYGRTVNGYLERDEALWQHSARPFGMESRAYTVGPAGRPEGFIVLRQISRDHGFDLHVKDFVALTPGGWSRLCTLLADHRSTVGRVSWDGPPADPRLLLFTEQNFKVEKLERLMARIVDVPAAFAGRGYPAHLEETLVLTVEDPLIPENAGAFTLRVAGGTGTVERGGTGGLRCGVRALAPLYSGLFSASVLAGLGRLTGSTEALAVADRLFSGQEPTLTDRF